MTTDAALRFRLPFRVRPMLRLSLHDVHYTGRTISDNRVMAYVISACG